VGVLFVCLFETEFSYVAQAGLMLEILLPQPPRCWDYSCAPPCPSDSDYVLYHLFLGNCLTLLVTMVQTHK
jgi:hypothetical protein